MNFLSRLSYKYGRYAIENLMNYIIGGMAIVFIFDLLVSPMAGISLSELLCFDRQAILSGQVWRIISFVFIPPDSSLIFMAFALYFYWLAGNTLEAHWGSFKFNVYYLVGTLGTILAGLLTGYATNDYLNLSLFFAFAALVPEMQMLLFFVIPIKIKWLAIFDGAIFLYGFLFSSWGTRVAMLMSIGNFLLFFGKDLWGRIKAWRRKKDFERKFRG